MAESDPLLPHEVIEIDIQERNHNKEAERDHKNVPEQNHNKSELEQNQNNLPKQNHNNETERNHNTVLINNQDSSVLIFSSQSNKRLCLLRDNRIYVFKRRNTFDVQLQSTAETNLILRLMSSPKYRAFNLLYIIFRFLKYFSLLMITIQVDYLRTGIIFNYVSGLEIINDLMLHTHNYWTLQRLKIYFGLVFNCFYAFFFFGQTGNEIVIEFLIIKFIAFIFVQCVNIAIDGELHNDLLILNSIKENEKESIGQNSDLKRDIEAQNDGITLMDQGGNSSLFSFKKFRKYIDVTKSIKMPEDVNYMGSIFAWGSNSVFNDNNSLRKINFPFWGIVSLCILPSLIAIFSISIFIIILYFIVFLIAVLLTYFFVAFCQCSWNPKQYLDYWKELTHF